jgi:hypothetical protein
MDPNVTALLVGTAGIAGTLAGVVIADLLAGRRDKASRKRQRRLLALQQTKQLIHAHLTDALQVAAGGASSRVYGSDVYPLADRLLVGDVSALNLYVKVAIDLFRRPAGERAKESDGRAVADVFLAVDAAIAKQEALALDDKALVEIPANRLVELAPLFERMSRS